MEVATTVRLRQELRDIREQVARMAEEHQGKGKDFKAAHFSVSSHLTELGRLVEKMSLEASQGPSGGIRVMSAGSRGGKTTASWCNVPGCNCHVKEG